METLQHRLRGQLLQAILVGLTGLVALAWGYRTGSSAAVMTKPDFSGAAFVYASAIAAMVAPWPKIKVWQNRRKWARGLPKEYLMHP